MEKSPVNSSVSDGGDAQARPARRKKKVMSIVNMWIRRIHLFSGLFMLPWVLLYGFSALLFNHPTYFTDSKTTVQSFQLKPSAIEKMPSATEMAELSIASAGAELDGATIEIAKNANAVFTRQSSGSVEGKDKDTTVVLDMNSGSGYLRFRSKDSPPEKAKSSDDEQPTLEQGIDVDFEMNSKESFQASIASLFAEHDLDESKFRPRGLPAVEFDAVVDGKPVRLRLTNRDSRRRRGSSDDSKKGDKEEAPTFRGKLSLVGANPRDMSVRSFLLRLHTAHGYPVQNNSRWFWAIAVDLMFASMCFWGISGVVMWWQIKRTRKIGFILLAASGIVATWLAIGMHWQLTNG
ncbi:MAG: PepSY domain-containing protein [Planctomycetota bacterium]